MAPATSIPSLDAVYTLYEAARELGFQFPAWITSSGQVALFLLTAGIAWRCFPGLCFGAAALLTAAGNGHRSLGRWIALQITKVSRWFDKK